MSPVVYLPLGIPLVAVVIARPLAHRLDPRYATWLLAGASATLAVCSTLALGVLTATGIAQVRPVASLGHWSAEAVRRADPSARTVALVAGTLLALAAVAAVRSVVNRALGLVAAHRNAAHLPGSDDLVVVPGAGADAFALPGRPGRIVVSEGMLAALDADGRRALVAHERAHLACRHYLFIAVTRLAAAVNPLLRPFSAAVEYTVERWADERAAHVLGDRTLVACAIGKAALVSAHSGPAGAAGSPALGVTGLWRHSRAGRESLAQAGPVPRRVAALLSPPPRPLALVMVAVLVAVLLAGGSALEAARDFHALIEVAQAARRVAVGG